jgi:hypothetical protein
MLLDNDITLPIRFERRFQLWYFTVSHGLLLLRSNRDSSLGTRLDVMFRGVIEMKVPGQQRGSSLA